MALQRKAQSERREKNKAEREGGERDINLQEEQQLAIKLNGKYFAVTTPWQQTITGFGKCLESDLNLSFYLSVTIYLVPVSYICCCLYSCCHLGQSVSHAIV